MSIISEWPSYTLSFHQACAVCLCSTHDQGKRGAYKEAWCRLSATETSFTWRQKSRFTYFLLLVLMIELPVDCCKNWKKKSRTVLQDFYPGKKTSGSCFWNGSTNIFLMMLFGYLTRTVTLELKGFWLSRRRNSAWIQQPKFSPSQKQSLFGCTCVFSGTKTEQAKTKNLQVRHY